MDIKSYFSTKASLSNINYVFPDRHSTYIIGPYKDIFSRARKNVYETHIEKWLEQPFVSEYNNHIDTVYKNSNWDEEYLYDGDEEYDDEYDDEYDEEYDEEYSEGKDDNDNDNNNGIEHHSTKETNVQYNDEQPIIQDVVEKLFDEIIDVVYDNGYEFNDTNLFKEDLTYFIYRLSKI